MGARRYVTTLRTLDMAHMLRDLGAGNAGNALPVHTQAYHGSDQDHPRGNRTQPIFPSLLCVEHDVGIIPAATDPREHGKPNCDGSCLVKEGQLQFYTGFSFAHCPYPASSSSKTKTSLPLLSVKVSSPITIAMRSFLSVHGCLNTYLVGR